MLDITVANLKDTEVGFRCDRTTDLGNPFRMRSEDERVTVIEAFRIYFAAVMIHFDDPQLTAQKIAANRSMLVDKNWQNRQIKLMPVRNKVGELMQSASKSPITLLCHCAPKPCHCDIIANYLHWQDSLKPKETELIIEEPEIREALDSLGF
jgi:Domain of unknown function (DUF4326)